MNNEKTITDIAVGIVTYNPDIDILAQNIDRIYDKSNLIFLFDNSSVNQGEIETLLKNKYRKVYLIKSEKNVGLGYAYNLFFERAIVRKYHWVMLLDQDSVCDSGLIDEYRKYINIDESVGMYTCIHRDRNLNRTLSPEFEGKYRDVKRCITSSSIMSVKAYQNGCRYDEKFFIDKLDYDICYFLQEKGYIIRQINYLGLSQEIGHSEGHKVFGHWITVYNHSPKRRYYMARNGVLLSKKHNQRSFVKSVGKEVCDILWVLIFEKDQKKEKFDSFCKGIIDGFKMRI